MNERRSSNAPLGSLVRIVLDGHPAFSANPVGDWNKIVGDQAARYSRPVSLKKEMLVVAVYDSVWKHHLELNRELLLEKINAGRTEPLVSKIVIRVGEVPESAPALNPNHAGNIKPKKYKPARREKVPLRTLTDEEREVLKAIADPELRAVATRLLKRLSD